VPGQIEGGALEQASVLLGGIAEQQVAGEHQIEGTISEGQLRQGRLNVSGGMGAQVAPRGGSTATASSPVSPTGNTSGGCHKSQSLGDGDSKQRQIRWRPPLLI